MNKKEIFVDAIRSKRKVKIKFNSKKEGINDPAKYIDWETHWHIPRNWGGYS